MPTLIACLSSGKGTWTEVVKIMKAREWDKIFLVTNDFGRENFKPDEKTELVVIDDIFDRDVSEIKEQIKKYLKGRINDFEVALNLVSGNGKEHMALLGAVLELGLNFRLVTLRNNQIEIM